MEKSINCAALSMKDAILMEECIICETAVVIENGILCLIVKPPNWAMQTVSAWSVHGETCILPGDLISNRGWDFICVLPQTVSKPSHRPPTGKIATSLRLAAVAACFDCSSLPCCVITRNYLSRQTTFRVEVSKHGVSVTAYLSQREVCFTIHLLLGKGINELMLSTRRGVRAFPSFV